MARYKVLSLLWSPSQSKYLGPGEVVEFGDEFAMVLLNKGVIEPAKYSRKGARSGASVRRPRPSDQKNVEVEGNDTDD